MPGQVHQNVDFVGLNLLGNPAINIVGVLKGDKPPGIRHLRTVEQPDSGEPGMKVDEFDALRTFAEIMP